MEIERKFLVNSLPCLKDYSFKKIIQAYLSTDPVIRIRQVGHDYFLTVKSRGHIMREEFEMPITKEQFDTLKKKIDDAPIEKIRYFIPLEKNLTAELDLYEGDLSGLCTVEVEFSSLEASNHFTPPSWFGADISLDSRYKNNNLARYGMPKNQL